MNWTGGGLSRHSRASNSVVNRQKQHFAKVQQNLRKSSRKRSPIKWSIFDLAIEDGERIQYETSTVQQQVSTFHSHEIHQPLLQHYTGLSSNSHITEQDNDWHSSQSQESAHLENEALAPINSDPIQVPGDGLCNATLLPRPAKRQRETSMPVSKTDSMGEGQIQEESTWERRRKILRKGDWVGVNIQRPLHLSFASPIKEQNIGKRRKLTDGHRARYAEKPVYLASPFPARHRRQYARDYGRHDGVELARTDVRISIGGRVVPPGISSSSAPRRIESYSTAARQNSQTTSSEVMLLDNEAAGLRELSIPSSLNKWSQNHCINISKHYTSSDNQISGPLMSGLEIENQTSLDSFECRHTNKDLSEGLSNTWDGCQAASQEEAPHQYSCEECQTPFETGTHTFTHNINIKHSEKLIFSLSSAAIHHPVPLSAKVSSLLHSGSSDIADSTTVQVGNFRPAVSSSQILDNEIWKSWVAPETDGEGSQSSDDLERQSINDRNSIGSAMSSLIMARHENKPMMSSFDDSSESDGLETRSQRSLSQGLLVGQPKNANEDNNLEVYGLGRTQMALEVVDATRKNPVQKSILDVEDIDEIWRRFVFDGSLDGSDIVDPTSPAIRSDIRSDSETLPDASMLAHGSTKSATEVTPGVHFKSREMKTAQSPMTTGHYQLTRESSHRIKRTSSRSSISSTSTTYSENFQTVMHASISASKNVRSPSHPKELIPLDHETALKSTRKVIFTRLRPFIGGKKESPNSPVLDVPFHTGRGLMAEKEEGSKRKRGHRDLDSVLNCDWKSKEVEPIDEYYD